MSAKTAVDFRYGGHKMLCQLRDKIMPARDDCQGFARFFFGTLNFLKTMSYKPNRSKCFNFIIKKMALPLKLIFPTSCGIKSNELTPKTALNGVPEGEKNATFYVLEK
jgi:hypothetical protein